MNDLKSMNDLKRVTMSDVAARAGVSAITVSRALRTPEKVTPQLRAEIARAVDYLGYVPHAAAQALASKRTDVIGVIIPSITNNVFADVMRGIYAEVDGTPFKIQLANTRYSPRMEENLLRIFLSQKPAGLVVTGIDQSETARALLDAAPCPVVQIMEIGDDPIDLMVGFSHQEAARAAAEHLLKRGYRKLAFLGARMDPRSQRRFHGFREAATAAGAFSEARVITSTSPSSATLGAQLFAELIDRAPDVDAIFCNNDDVALGVMFEARRHNVSIPDQIGLCGFNDLETMAVAEPPVTSVRTFRYEMGRRAINMLVDAMSEKAERKRAVVDLGFEIRARQSTNRSMIERHSVDP